MVNQEDFHDFCMAMPHVTAGFPFNESVLVYKVHNKIFALADIEEWQYVNLKSEPEKALELRAEYEGITPGYHMSKKHWNSVSFDGSIKSDLIYNLTELSYHLVFQSLPKKLREITNDEKRE